jgi:hypothetical protein
MGGAVPGDGRYRGFGHRWSKNVGGEFTGPSAYVISGADRGGYCRSYCDALSAPDVDAGADRADPYAQAGDAFSQHDRNGESHGYTDPDGNSGSCERYDNPAKRNQHAGGVDCYANPDVHSFTTNGDAKSWIGFVDRATR